MPNLDRSLCALTLLLTACGDGMPGDEPSETTGEPTGTSPTDPTDPTEPTEPTEPPPSVDPFGGAYPQADLADPQVVQALSVGSAQGMILFSTWPLREIDESDPCPSVTVEGDTSTVTGGCTDALGQEWFGTLIVQTERIEYRQFGRRQSFLCDVGAEEVVTSIAFDGAVVDVSESDVRIDLTVQGQVGRPTDCVEEPVGVEARYDATVSSDGSGVSLSGEGVGHHRRGMDARRDLRSGRGRHRLLLAAPGGHHHPADRRPRGPDPLRREHRLRSRREGALVARWRRPG